MQTTPRFHAFYVMIAILGVFLLHDLWVAMTTVKTVPYSEFLQLVRDDKVTDVVITTNEIRGTLKEPASARQRYFRTTRVDGDLAGELAEHEVTFSGRVENKVLPTLLSWIIPVALFFGVWVFLMKRMSRGMGAGGGLMSIGKSKAKVYVETDTKVAFSDVAGADEAKAELAETVAFLKDPQAGGRLGARMPKGILLVGPPGTGKTLLARAVAGEAGVPFFSISGSDFVEMFVGVGAARVRDLFEQARAKAPAIVFIDELDALGRARAASPYAGGGHDEKEQTLNQLLVEMDGFDPASGIVLLAATNRPEVLDPALLRAGRFDRQILVDRPEKAGRAQVLAVHVKKVTLGPDVELEQVAALTPGFTGADLANLVNEAALAATRRGADAVAMTDFNTAIERIVAGLERKNRLLNPRERRDRGLPRDGPRPACRGHRRLRPGAQGVDHPPRHRRPRLHHPAPHRGPLPHDARRARGQDGRPDGRPGRRARDLRPPLDGRLGRPRPHHRHRPQHGHALWHGAQARPRGLRERTAFLPRRPPMRCAPAPTATTQPARSTAPCGRP